MADPTVQGPLSAASTTSETSEPTAALSTIGQPVKFTGGGKGTLGTITPTAGAILDENSSKAILANMQNMLDEYSSPKKGLEDALMKAHAWTMYNKEPMFRQIQQQEEQDRANKYNISQGMASIQAMQNQNKILQEEMSGGAKTAGAGVGAGVGTGIPGIPGNQQDYARYLKRTNPVEFEKLLTSYNVKQPDALKIMDAVKGMEDTPQNREILRQTFPKSFEPQVTVDANGARHESMPDIGALFRQANAPTATGVPVFNDPSIRITSTQRNAQQGKDLYQTSVDAGTPGVQPNGIPVAKPGTSPHETLPAGDVLDIDPSKLTTSGRTELAQKGYYQPYGKDSPHWQKIPPVGSSSTVISTPAAALAKSPAEYEANLKKNEAFNTSFLKSTYEPLAAKVASQIEDTRLAKQVLGSLNSNTFGPGTSIDQALSTGLQTIGFEGAPEEAGKYIDNLNIEMARKLLATSTMRSALGPQFTAEENKAYTELTPGIDKPKELLKQYYQFRIADAEINKDRLRYMMKHKDDPIQADMDWEASGARERILKEHAPIYAKIQKRAEEIMKENGSPKAAAKTVTRTGLITKQGHPDYGKTVTEYSDGTREIK